MHQLATALISLLQPQGGMTPCSACCVHGSLLSRGIGSSLMTLPGRSDDTVFVCSDMHRTSNLPCQALLRSTRTQDGVPQLNILSSDGVAGIMRCFEMLERSASQVYGAHARLRVVSLWHGSSIAHKASRRTESIPEHAACVRSQHPITSEGKPSNGSAMQ